jgi:hypothetical protein
MGRQEAHRQLAHLVSPTTETEHAPLTETDRFLTVKETCQLTRLSEASIRRRLGKVLPKYKAGARTLVKLADALALIRKA